MNEFPVETLTSQPFAYVSRSATLADMPRAMGEGFAILAGLFGKANAPMAGAPLAHYLSFEGGKATFDLGFPARPGDVAELKAAGLSIGETPSGRAMKAIHVGPYESGSQTYDAMGASMKRLGLSGTQDMWERYLSGPEVPPAQIRTEVIWPVSSAG